MLRSLIVRRDAAADRHDRALAKFPTRQGAAFVTEIQAVIAELEEVAAQCSTSEADGAEYARTLSWIGAAYFDLAEGKDAALLARSAEYYVRAEQALPPGDSSLTAAKISFSFANTLRGQSQGTNVDALESAEHRYERALAVFKREGLRDLVVQAEQNLATLRSQITLARSCAQILGGARASPGPMRAALTDAVSDIGKALADHPERFERGSEKLADVRGEVDKLASVLETLGSVPGQTPDQAIIHTLRTRLAKEMESGTVTPTRARALESLLGRARSAMTGPDGDLDSLAQKADLFRALTRQAMDGALDPSFGGPPLPPGSRSARLHALLRPLKQYLLEECARQTGQSNSRANDLFARTSELDAAVHQGANRPDVRELSSQAWALARDVRHLARASHAMVATPRWPVRNRREDARAVVVSGLRPGPLRQALLKESELNWLLEPTQGELPVERYAQLRSASLGVFFLHPSLGEGKPDREGARLALATTCYELGLALTLGVAPVVVVEGDAPVPFNVPVEVVRVAPGADPAPILDAVEHAAFGIVWGGRTPSANRGQRRTYAFVEETYARGLQGAAAMAWRMVSGSLDHHPMEFADRLQRFLASQSGPELIFPAWPPEYPAGSARCFHVTPFRDWSRRPRDVVESVCQKHRVAYSRGDETDEQAIIVAIWNEIARSSHVLVDVTNLNPNVALELGITHGLGKRYRLVYSRDADADGARESHLFGAIAKDRVHGYASQDGFAALRDQVSELLAPAVEQT